MTFTKLFIRSFGRLSNGISLCLKEGLTSGKVLDYVCQNQPSGKGVLGRWIDEKFLKHQIWGAIRIRRKLLEKLLFEAVKEKQKALKIVDIASGSASYIFSVLRQIDKVDVQAICQDLDSRLLEEGRSAATEMKMQSVTFRQGNALDTAWLDREIPNIVISMGVYENIHNISKIRESICSIYKSLAPSGVFILTIQTDYPQFHLVESIFTKKNTAHLQMTTQSADEMTAWLETVGFLVEKTLRDPYGYYAVFKVRKL